MRTLILSSLLLAACGSQPDFSEVREAQFLTIGDGYSGVIKYVKEPVIHACLSGLSGSDISTRQKDITSVVMAWIAPLRELTSLPLAESVDFVDNGCRISVSVNSSWPHTNIEDPPTVSVGYSGYTGSYNTLLHEFGHAFGLGDTYLTTSGHCKADQPQAVMCNTSFSVLQEDDINGVRAVFQKTYPQEHPL